ncbi:MAG: hypothetical protein [Fushun totivirus 5]|nr:MAG: hypothetical protein [Fushun totivirus 5]
MTDTRPHTLQGADGDLLSLPRTAQSSSHQQLSSSSLENTSQMETQGDINAVVLSSSTKNCDSSDALVESYLTKEKGYSIEDTPIPVIQGFFSFKKPVILNSRKTEPSFQTEQLKAHHYPYTDFSPSYNFDAFRIVHMSDRVGTTPKKKISLNMTGFKSVEVNQNFYGICAYPRPVLTDFGRQVINLSNQELSSTGAIRSMVPTRNLKDQNTLVSLLVSNFSQPECIFDEAPFVRLMLLLSIMQRKTEVGYTQACVQQLFANCIGKIHDTLWLSAPPEKKDDTRCEQISSENGTSSIACWSMRKFTKYVTGEQSMPDVDYDTVFIPVSVQDSGKSWLLPYILSFTTTSWWLGCAGAKAYIQDRKTGEGADSVFVHMVNEASLTSIKGAYERIVLIQIDCWNETIMPFQLRVDQEIVVINNDAWYDQFARVAYKWLGRTALWNVIPDRGNDLTNALSMMQKHLGVPGLFARCRTLCAELAFSRIRTNYVYTNGAEKPKQKTKTEIETDIDGIIAALEKNIFSLRLDALNYEENAFHKMIKDAIDKDPNITPLHFPIDSERLAEFITSYMWRADWRTNSELKTDVETVWTTVWNQNKQTLKTVLKTFFSKSTIYTETELNHTFWNGYSYICKKQRDKDPSYRISVGDQVLKDVTFDYKDSASYDSIKQSMYAQILCRCSPMQKIPNSLGCSKITTDDEGQFEISVMDRNYYQYSVSQSSYISRILVASNIWVKLPYLESTRIADSRNEVLNQINLASVLSIQAEWLRCFFGFEVFDYNGLVPLHNYWNRMFFSLGHVCTYGFITSDLPNPHMLLDTLRSCDHSVNQDEFNLLAFFKTKLRDDVSFFDLRGGVVPYWLLLNYIMKLSKNAAPFATDVEVTPVAIVPTDGYFDTFRLNLSNVWYDAPLLASSIRYDKEHFFQMLTHDFSSKLSPFFCSFGTYSTVDSSRQSQYTLAKTQSFFSSPYPKLINVELDTLALPALRGPPITPNLDIMISDESNPNSKTLKSNPNFEKFAPRLTAPLQYPDPFFDWLMKVAPGVVENLLSGNPAGALSHVVSEAAEPVSQWLVDNVPSAISSASDWLFRD